MQQRDISWLKTQEINKKFTVCKEADQKHVNDVNFEDWIVTEGQKRPATMFGDGFKTDETGFSFCWDIDVPPKKNDPFPFIEPIYARFKCPWEHVMAIYESDSGRVYIFAG